MRFISLSALIARPFRGAQSVPAATVVASDSTRTARKLLAPLCMAGALGLSILGLRAQNSAPPVVAVSRHAINNNGRIEGSAQQLLGESVNLNGGAFFGGDLLVPGQPRVQVNGHPNWSGQKSAGGSSAPSNYGVKINSSATLGYLVTKSDPIAFDLVAEPPAPRGNRNINVNSARDAAAINWSTLRDLTLNGGAPEVAVPPGAYGNFSANNGGGLVLGVAGSGAPQRLQFAEPNA